MTKTSAVSLAVILLAATAPAGTAADAPADRGTVVVTTEDGSIVPCTTGPSPTNTGWPSANVAPPRSHRAQDGLGARRRQEGLPTTGQILTITYSETMRSTESDTGVKTEKIKTPKELTLTGADGRKTTLKVEAPARELLVESLEKGTTLMARTLDVQGETVTGTRKDFCLVSYTAVVECGGTAADRVVKVEFQK